MNKTANLFKDETEKAIVHFIVYLIGIVLILCVYYNYIILKYYFYSLFWAFIISIPLHHVKVKLKEFFKKKIIKKKKNAKSVNGKTYQYIPNEKHETCNKYKNEKLIKNKGPGIIEDEHLLHCLNYKDGHTNIIKKKKDSYKKTKTNNCTKENKNEDKYQIFQKYTNNTQHEDDLILKNKASYICKKAFYNLVKNIRKELDIYLYIFFLIIKPIYKKEEKKDNFNNSFDSYENGNDSEIYFLILHRFIFFYILRGIFYKYKEFLLSISSCIFFLYVFYKIIKIIWFQYFYKIYRKYYEKYSFLFTFDLSFIYKRYLNDILTILIIILAIIIFSSISVFFIFNIYGESVYIINSLNNYLSVNFKNAAIIKNFKRFYKKGGKEDIENLYELVDLSKVPFLSNTMISSIYSHLKRAIDIYENIYLYNFTKNKNVSLKACCLSLLVKRFVIIKNNNLYNVKKFVLALNEQKKHILEKNHDFKNKKCMDKDENQKSVFFSLKKIIQYLSKNKFFSSNKSKDIVEDSSSSNNNNNNNNNDKTNQNNENKNNSVSQNIFKTVFENLVGQYGNVEQKQNGKSPERASHESEEEEKKKKKNINKQKDDLASSEKDKETNKKKDGIDKKIYSDNKNKDNDDEKKDLQGLKNMSKEKTSNNFMLNIYDPAKERNFKIKEFMSYVNNLFLSLKKIEDLGKLTKFLIFNNSYGLLKIMIFFVLIFFNFFMFTFDAIVQAVIFFTALYYLISSKKSVLNYLKDVLLVVDPSSIFFYNITNNLKAIIICTLKRIYFYALYIWLIFSFFQFPIIYVPTLLCIILSLIPVISPEILILVIILHLWIIKKQKIISLILFIVNFFIYCYFSTSIYNEIPHTHAWLVSLSLFLSISTFGSKGLILGPLIGSIPLILHQVAIHKNKSVQSKKKKKEKGKKKLSKNDQLMKKYTHKQLQKKFNQFHNIIKYSEQKYKKFKKKRNEKALLWKNKLDNLYKLIEINRSNIHMYQMDDKKNNSNNKTDQILKRKISPFQQILYDDFMHKEDHKLALYIYRRNKEINNGKKTNHNLISKKIHKTTKAPKHKFQYNKRTKSLIYLYDKFQQNLDFLFSCITSNN
ncbi:hypothetical protein PFNF135_01507 [Plasmodium falciparum NF135/5.C10]|uniref:Uncharacterized protein n=1 Tax=Plasmodium falciparum NF135/5.C10 TaxID=1036726 RepID=W4ILD2_PLAFA|nr:hypothetical protein PFNF135_01507 [Plasmodium falciparum NF135/5.C10]